MGEVAVAHVYAYLDPGSASLLFQAAIATIVALPYMLRRQLASIWNSVFRRPHDRSAAPLEPDDSPH
jgi:hypothetical protein